jgi:hypothetical protein
MPMARQVVFTDDLDGSPNAKTIPYRFDGVDYEIDLSEKNEKEFRDVLDKYITASRRPEKTSPSESISSRASTRRRSSSSRSSGAGREDLAEIRKWAQDEGLDVAARGRIKQEIIDKYDEAHGT